MLGLLLGRVGDALGTALELVLAGRPVALIVLTAGFFMVAMGLFFGLYQRLYLSGHADGTAAVLREPAPDEQERARREPASDEQERARHERATFERFCAEHGLTARERDVLRLMLKEKSNAEIAGELGVQERTVKFHVGNLLKKTGCKSRLEVLAAFAGVRTTRE